MSRRDPHEVFPSNRTGEASDWLLRLQAADVAETDVAAWLRWCAADKANLEAFERVQSLYDKLQALSPSDRETFLRSRSVATADGASQGMFRRVRTWSKGHVWPVVAGVSVVVLVVAWGMAAFHARSSLLESQNYRVPKGAQQALLLADRSRVTLASASELSSHFTPETRYVDLRQGEAYFEVQHEPSRPFVVQAGGITVTAVGTKFNVRTSGNRTVVAVTEGAVDVRSNEIDHDRSSGSSGGTAGTTTSPVRLSAGQEAVCELGQPGLMVVDVSAAAATGWQQGRLEYVMEPLSSVVDNVNRYSKHHIVIEDSSVGAMVFTGTVFVDRVDDWAMTLPSAFPVVTSVGADGTLTVSRQTEDSETGFR